MASYIDDEIDGSLGGGQTEGNMMGATSIDMTQAAPRRAAAAAAATGTATEAEIDWKGEALMEQQMGHESNREKTATVRALTEAFQQTLAAIPGLSQQLDLLQQNAAAICLGMPAGGKSIIGGSSGRSSNNSTLQQRLILSISDIISVSSFSFYSHPLIKQPCAALPALENAVAEEWKNRGALGPAPRVGVGGCPHPRIHRAVYITEDALQHQQQLLLLQQQQNSTAPPIEVEREIHLRSFYDVSDLDKDIRDAQPPPQKDPEGRKVNRQELGYCQYQNHQKFFVQEAPETAPTGQLPRWVEVLAAADLSENVKCGDRVRVFGVYRPRAGPANNQTSGYVRPLLIANNIEVLNAAARASMLQSLPADLMNIKAFASRRDLFEVMSRSIAPAVCGHDVVKRGLLLQLCGGSSLGSSSSSQHRVRGDIHVLLLGDPSAGKSQLLRFVLRLLPGAVSTTGRGSSGVGLTAAVVSDADTAERRVEAGAMVMGDRSIVCIDEFDKMHAGDRAAIHEVMEQQTVSVAKAGIHTTLNARCSVLAAANPLYGCWSPDLPFASQIAFEDSLLSRFDLIFILRDAASCEEDERLAEAVLRNVSEKAKPAATATTATAAASGAAGERRIQGDCFIQPQSDMHKPTHAAGAADLQQQEDAEPTKAFYHRNEMLYYDKQGREHECLTHEFLHKYIELVRCGGLAAVEDGDLLQQQQQQQQGPRLSESAAAALADFYTTIRQRALQQREEGSTASNLLQPVTEDVNVAQQLLLHTLFGEDTVDDEGEADTETESEEEEEEDTTARRRKPRKQTTDKEEMALEMESLEIGEKKKRGTKRGAAAAAASAEAGDRNEALQSLNAQGLSSDILQSLILHCIKQLDQGSGVSEAALLEALFVDFVVLCLYFLICELIFNIFVNLVSARALSRGLLQPTAEEFQKTLHELNSKDSAPILVHDGLVYEC
ncbi:DNA replication licensing factor, putative [Eimeria maxima]|uniref:DNA replication licensing factor, putative n=1 Tax=Eimeria maxima TaxID=5804 RepID=U6M9W5_EIMMA|nr:DNA replication licensing factor, putative [Eimeria maxima]CDJ60821.1 DNA replication licensing factor, putative [Eimeria maxima]